jgi:hypothetical protein
VHYRGTGVSETRDRGIENTAAFRIDPRPLRLWRETDARASQRTCGERCLDSGLHGVEQRQILDAAGQRTDLIELV